VILKYLLLNYRLLDTSHTMYLKRFAPSPCCWLFL